MRENRIGTFILEPDETPYEARSWLTLTIYPETSVLVGNPDGGEYFALYLLSYNSDVARFVISEKRGGGAENDIKHEQVDANKSYVLQGTEFALRWQNTNPKANRISIWFSAPGNVDIVR